MARPCRTASSETVHLVNATLPAVAKQLRDGTSTDDALVGVQPPADPQLRQLVHAIAAAAGEGVQHAAALDGERKKAQRELIQAVAELDRLAQQTLPAAVAWLREGQSADRVLTELDLLTGAQAAVLTVTIWKCRSRCLV
jgi:hypothetical protein